MSKAQLYFLTDQYYIDFPDDKLMRNKDIIDGTPHNRPCFFAFPDAFNENIYWIVPISSKYEKYKKIEQAKIQKYGKCDTIRFGTVLDRNTAFLIQNMCPATEKYLIAYIDKNNTPIRIDDRIAEDVSKNARLVLAKAKRGAKVVFPDIFKIYQALEQQMQSEQVVSPNIAGDKPSVLAKLQKLKEANNSGKTVPTKQRTDREER